ncbi:MAG: formate/nitrite transporter family protein [Candidatus Peribacteria bacterium]|jgi:formate/nitrite transporter|nr:formate/nitrite transporter family protein [Candidatus Peribacteria bacterium]
MNETLTPAEITAQSTTIAIEKTRKPFHKILINGILAGMFIGIGAMFSINSITGLEVFPYGLTKLIAGLTFSIGLILVMIAGADLFTGDALMITAVVQKKLNIQTRGKHLLFIRISNFLGTLLLILLLHFAGRDHFANGTITETILNIGEKKLHYGRRQALSLGILCNILVCLGVRLARAGKRAIDKIAGIIFPVTAFVACGFEHSVANMFYLPYAYLLGLETSSSEILWNNLLPVSI